MNGNVSARQKPNALLLGIATAAMMRIRIASPTGQEQSLTTAKPMAVSTSKLRMILNARTTMNVRQISALMTNA